MTTTTTYFVSGMTCGHCVSAVTDEVGKLDGVDEVAVDLNAGGESRLTVISGVPLEEATVRAAVDEAGYQLTSTQA